MNNEFGRDISIKEPPRALHCAKVGGVSKKKLEIKRRKGKDSSMTNPWPFNRNRNVFVDILLSPVPLFTGETVYTKERNIPILFLVES